MHTCVEHQLNVGIRRRRWYSLRQRLFISYPLYSVVGAAGMSPLIGASWMARLGNGGNTPAGLVSACLTAVMALRHNCGHS